VSKSNNLDEVIGIVLLKDLFTPTSDKTFDITDYLKTPIYFNETTHAYRVLELFKKEKMHYGIVVDEYGTTMGIVTMDDVVDALVGDVTENDQDEYKIIQRSDNSWLVDGQYSILEFVKHFGLPSKEEYQTEFTTVAGLIMFESNRLPEVGEKFILEDLELEVIDKDGQRIDKILVTKLPIR
jgi:putative hemolysin